MSDGKPLEAQGLVKLSEECGELIQIAMKRIAFGGNGEHWDNKGNLKIRLEDEIADVLAATRFVIEKMNLDVNIIHKRGHKKLALFNYWDKGGKEITLPDE